MNTTYRHRAQKLLLITLFIVISPVHAQQSFLVDAMFESGIDAYKQQDYQTAKTRWYRAANRGHLRAMFGLAQLYQTHELGEPNPEQAKHWYLKASKQGSALAQFQLSKLYLAEGDIEQAEKWMIKSARGDYREAQYELAVRYETGNDFARSPDSAVEWYLQAAESGVTEAQIKLIDLYLHGTGIEQNEQLAFSWAAKASNSGNAQAKFLLGYMYSTGTGTVYSPDIARLWLQEALDEGVASAQQLLDEIERQQDQPGAPKPLSRKLLVATGF